MITHGYLPVSLEAGPPDFLSKSIIRAGLYSISSLSTPDIPIMAYTSYFSSKIERLIYFGLVLLVANFTKLTVAAPVDASGYDTVLYRRVGQCPSIDTIRQHFRGHMSTNTVFYTSPASHIEASGVAAGLQPAASYFGSLVSNPQYLDWITECGPGPEQDKLAPRISIALAREAKGTAYLVTRGAVKATSIWTLYEFPAVQRNAGISHVYQYDLGTKEYTLIWTAGSTPTLTEHVV